VDVQVDQINAFFAWVRQHPEEVNKFLHWAQKNPAEWIEKMLECRLWHRQVEICESVRDNKYTCVASGNHVGKDHVAGRLALWWLYSFPHSLVITTGPTDRQVRDVIWGKNIIPAWKGARDKLIRLKRGGPPLLQRLQLEEDWFAIGFTSKDEQTRFSGFASPHVLVLITEASGIEGTGLWLGLEGVLSSEHTRLLEVGNPTATEVPYAHHFLGKEGKRYHKIYISAWEAPTVQAEFHLNILSPTKGRQ